MKILYLNSSPALTEQIEEVFKYHHVRDLEKLFLSEKEPQKVQLLLPKILTFRPDVVIIDFSTNELEIFNLARTLVSQPSLSNTIFFSFHGEASSLIELTFLLGIKNNFVIDEDLADFTNAISPILNFKFNSRFAIGELNEKFQSFILNKVGFIKENSMHIETDLKLPAETVFSYFDGKRSCFKVLKESSETLYKLNYAYNLQKVSGKNKLQSEIPPTSKNCPKKTRIFLADPSFKILESLNQTNSYSFALSLSFSYDLPKLEKLNPHLIIVERIESEEYNLFLKTIFETLRRIKSKAIVLLFNEPTPGANLISTYGYPKILSFNQNVDANFLTNLYQRFYDKKAFEFDDEAFYFKKEDPASVVYVQNEICIELISELNCRFTSKLSLAPGTIFKLPVLDTYCFVDEQDSVHPNTYRASFIASTPEAKKKLRVCVQQAQFKDLTEARKIELNEFLKLNNSKAQELNKSAS